MSMQSHCDINWLGTSQPVNAFEGDLVSVHCCEVVLQVWEDMVNIAEARQSNLRIPR